MPGPENGDYPEYYGKKYIKLVPSGDILDLLEQQLHDLVALLTTIGEDKGAYRYGPDKWSIKEVIGHLIDTERVFIFRAMSIARDEKQSLPGFDQDDYVVTGGFDARPVKSLMGEYETVRNASVAFFESLDAASWLKTGMANDVKVSVRAIGYIVPGHEVHHLAILQERYLSRL